MDRTSPETLSNDRDRRGGNLRVLIVDDEKNIRLTLALCLQSMDCRVSATSSADAALANLERQAHDLAFVDVQLGHESGLVLAPRLRALQADLEIVVMTAHPTLQTAVEALRGGACDYMSKPFTPAELQRVLDRFSARRHWLWAARTETLAKATRSE